MSAPTTTRPAKSRARTRTTCDPLRGIGMNEYGRLVDSRYAPRDARGRVVRPNLVIWRLSPLGKVPDAGAVAALIPLTDEERAMLRVDGQRFGSHAVEGQTEVMIRAAARHGYDLTAPDGPEAELDWSGSVTGAVLDRARTR